MTPIAPDSDCVALTVRWTADGHREWLDARGTTALVFHERGVWWSRPDAATATIGHANELEALSALLDCDLRTLRNALRPGLRGTT